MKILVTGGREYNDQARVYKELDALLTAYPANLCIIQGGARGADKHARNWAELRVVCCATFHAWWNTGGKGAGIVRNNWMLQFCAPDWVIAFPGGNGTAHMKKAARKLAIPVYEIKI